MKRGRGTNQAKMIGTYAASWVDEIRIHWEQNQKTRRVFSFQANPTWEIRNGHVYLQEKLIKCSYRSKYFSVPK